MSNALRPLLLALALLVLGGIAVFAQVRVHQKSRVAVSLEKIRWQERVTLFAQLHKKPPSAWDANDWVESGRVLGGNFRLLHQDAAAGTGELVVMLPGNPSLRAAFSPQGGWALERRHSLLQQGFLWLLTAAFIAVLLVALMPAKRRGNDEEQRVELRREIDSVEQLARTTVTQAEALDRERRARHHSEETLHLQQILLNRSLEEKIRLGRDLHDGLIQSLYATGLALEAARGHVGKDPAKAISLIERCVGAINTAIKEVRHEIENLAPVRVRRGNFKSAIEAVLELLDAKRTASIDLRVPEDASRRIPPESQAELLQIVRESVSNAIRHGEASQIEIRLEAEGDQLCLGIRDNGHGFDPDKLKRRGHGLTNLQARAEAMNGQLRIDSTPGSGARIVITFPNDHPATT